MFTGIVEDLGEVEAVDQQGDFARIYVRSAVVTSDARLGDSICVSGVCLTVTGASTSGRLPPPSRGFTADVMGETLRHSSLKSLSPGTKVNLERSVRLEDRLGGHLVQGHTDGTGTILSRVSHTDWDVVRISLPADLARYVVHKGSITVDGISLTVSALSPGGTTRPQASPPDARAARPPGPGAPWRGAPAPHFRRLRRGLVRGQPHPRDAQAHHAGHQAAGRRGQPRGRRDREVRGEAD